MAVIVIDCDGPLVDLGSAWYAYLEEVTGLKVPKKEKMDYDLTTYFKKELAYEGITGFEYLGMEGIYDDLEPVKGSVEALQRLKSYGHTLICLSVETGLHGASKRFFLRQHFPMLDAIYFCEKGTKHLLPCDYIIEDRVQEVALHSNQTKAIIFNTPYLDPVETKCKYKVLNTWQEIEESIYWSELYKQIGELEQ